MDDLKHELCLAFYFSYTARWKKGLLVHAALVSWSVLPVPVSTPLTSQAKPLISQQDARGPRLLRLGISDQG